MKMPFGKYKGQELEDLPADYIEWVLTECTINYSLEEELQNQLIMKQGGGVVRKNEKD